MSRSVRERLARLEHQRADLLAELARVSRTQLEWRPGAGEWSIAQVLDHLAAAEEAVVGQATGQVVAGRTLAALDRGPVSLRQRVRRWYRRRLVFTILRTGVRVRMPRRVVEMVGLPGDVTAAAAKARWEAARSALAAHLETLPDGAVRRPFMHHPVTGPLDHAQGLDFLHAHVAHHRRQIRRIRRAGRF